MVTVRDRICIRNLLPVFVFFVSFASSCQKEHSVAGIIVRDEFESGVDGWDSSMPAKISWERGDVVGVRGLIVVESSYLAKDVGIVAARSVPLSSDRGRSVEIIARIKRVDEFPISSVLICTGMDDSASGDDQAVSNVAAEAPNDGNGWKSISLKCQIPGRANRLKVFVGVSAPKASQSGAVRIFVDSVIIRSLPALGATSEANHR